MVKLFSRKPAVDPATKRYPEALAGLLTLGQPDDNTDYEPWAESLKGYVPDLIRMALDKDLNQRYEDDPAVWAPLHALQILGVLGAAEAAEPLTACLDWDDDWTSEALPDVYAGIGPAAIPFLQKYLENSAHDIYGRSKASGSLAAIAQAHPEMQKDIVAYLAAFLDRPAANASAAEETLTAFVICDLGDLGDRSAYPAIKRAFDENRVDTQILGLEDVEADFGLRPKYDYSKLPLPPEEPGVRLSLRCKVCGRERFHLFPVVYYDMATARQKKPKYDPLVIPQRVVCPKCGAVDQYELGDMGQIAITADLLALKEPTLRQFLREDQRVKFMEFTSRWGPMHPLEAVERYQTEIARDPDNAVLHVGYGNVLKLLGRTNEAEAEFQRGAELDPGYPEAWVNLAYLAQDKGDYATAIAHWERVLAVLPQSNTPPQQRQEFLDLANESLRALRAGRKPDYVVEPPRLGKAKPSPAPATKPQPARPAQGAPPKSKASAPAKPMESRPIPRVGRNERCPCGSGKKYKHCHGRKKK
jgi:tetratricopeptide (TPR) repeat protein